MRQHILAKLTSYWGTDVFHRDNNNPTFNFRYTSSQSTDSDSPSDTSVLTRYVNHNVHQLRKLNVRDCWGPQSQQTKPPFWESGLHEWMPVETPDCITKELLSCAIVTFCSCLIHFKRSASVPNRPGVSDRCIPTQKHSPGLQTTNPEPRSAHTASLWIDFQSFDLLKNVIREFAPLE